MSERLTLEHNGRELTFLEHDESWQCYSMRMSAKSLKALRAKLDKFDGQARRVSVPVLVTGIHNEKAQRAEIVLLAKPKDWETDHNAKIPNFGGYGKKPSVWVTTISGNETKREKVSLDRCVPILPEVSEALEAAQAKFAEARSIEREAKAIIASLPRLSIEDLMARSVVEDGADDAPPLAAVRGDADG